MRQDEIKEIKLCQVRKKVIALGWYWVAMIFLGQINPKIHCSPGMHYLQGKTKKILYKSEKASWKWTIFGSSMVQFFLLITCFCTHMSLKKIACPYFTCISDFVSILATRYCKPFLTSAYTLSGKSKQLKKLAVKLVTTKKETFWGIINIFIFYVGPWVN